MEKKTGIHFYINIVNYNQIIMDEEKSQKRVTHSIHALDTFFTSIMKYGKKVSNKMEIEKITGSRLHLYIVDDLLPAYNIVKAVSTYAYMLAGYMNREISKYNMLKDLRINVGADYGEFYTFEFITKEGYSETTSIGYAANFAAKLQSLSGSGKLSISKVIYHELSPEEKKIYEQVDEDCIKKYDQDKYYTVFLSHLNPTVDDGDLQAAKDYANSDNLSDIEFETIRKPLNFADLSRKKCKKLEGIPVFVDVRGFTNQFKKDDGNLDEMSKKTQEILESMYRVTIEHGGVHVQFQGDRELSVYHNIPAGSVNGVNNPVQKCFKTAVLASMRMIDAVPYSVHVGIGEDFGVMYATKIGARGEKDSILLGETVIRADSMEENNAAEDQVAITAEVYLGLKEEDDNLANQFKEIGGYYVSNVGYNEYVRDVSYHQQSTNTSMNNYNGAWRN